MHILAVKEGLRLLDLSESSGGECFEKINLFVALAVLFPTCFKKVR